jgi:hypothetical protein
VGSSVAVLLLLDVRLVWTDDRSLFSPVLESLRDGLLQSSPDGDEPREDLEQSFHDVKESRDDREESSPYLMESSHYVKESSHYVKESSHYVKESPIDDFS